ncbi:hypothetical protein [uncultured Halomonas sp.]|nr:hypothetical protein [uncultured Halomonas sp.]
MTPELVFLAMYVADGMPLSFYLHKINMLHGGYQMGAFAEGLSVTPMVQ